MTSKELYNKLKSHKTETLTAQLLQNGLSVNMSSFYTKLIKDAARCSNYSSDVVYDIQGINKRLENFNPEEDYEPIWIGFRRQGVDHAGYILSRIDGLGSTLPLWNTYFALYSVTIEHDEGEFYKILLNEYWT